MVLLSHSTEVETTIDGTTPASMITSKGVPSQIHQTELKMEWEKKVNSLEIKIKELEETVQKLRKVCNKLLVTHGESNTNYTEQ